MNIPKNLFECFEELKHIASPEQFDDFKSGTEESVIQYHNGFGRWMRNEWGLWSGGSLKNYFEFLDIHHPDDMSGIILTSFHRHVNNLPLKLDEQIQRYKDFWATHE